MPIQKGKQKQRMATHAYGDSMRQSDVSTMKPYFAEPHVGKKKVVTSLTENASEPSVKHKGGRKKPTKNASGGQSKKVIIKNQDRKHQEDESRQLAVDVKELEEKLERGLVSKETAIDQLDRKLKKAKYASSEILLLTKALTLQSSILKFEKRVADVEARRRESVDLVRRIRYLYKRNHHQLTEDQLNQALSSWKGLGFPVEILTDDRLEIHLSEEPQDLLNLRIDWIDYMFRYGGQLMDIQNDPQVDQRVDFEPDGWQRELLDAIDSHQSALVIAPTSAGKTFVSYYCIEKVLKDNQAVTKETELGFVVYVSPTKALVNQVAATIYAKFSDHSCASGYPVYGVFTSDYGINVDRCQVLVTVPQCLDILLMLPSRERWINQLRFVILDEIHCIGGSYIEGDDENVWEHIVKMFPCPFLALSATVGNPSDLYKWFQDVEQHKFVLGIRTVSKNQEEPQLIKLVNYSERYSELHHHLFAPCLEGRPSQTWRGVADKPQRSGGGMLSFHPLAVYSASSLAEHDFPKDQCLTAAETIQLYDAMASVDAEVAETLCPTKFFCRQSWLTRADLRSYEKKLKKTLSDWARGDDQVDEGMQKADSVLSRLQKNCQAQLDAFPLESDTATFASQHVTGLVERLRADKMLPCLAFGDNRSLCEALAYIVANDLERQEKKFRKHPSSVDRVSEWEEKKIRLAKDSRKKRDRKLPPSAASKRPDSDDEWLSSASSLPFPLDLSRFTLTHPGMGGDLMEERKQTMTQRGEASVILFRCLDRGIGFHHSGMTLSQRQTVEMLFRGGYLGVVFTTSTLALGIHMPCRSVTFTCDSMHLTPLKYRQMAGRAGRRGFDTSGNVIFFALPTKKIKRLLTGSLPLLHGTTPLTAGTLLRLLTMCDHAKNKSLTVSRARVLLDNHFITYSWNSKLAKTFNRQMQLYVMFCAEFLRSMSLIDGEGRPSGLAGVVNHLSYHQPGCFVFVYFLQNGVFHDLLGRFAKSDVSKTELLKTVVLVLSHLFTSIPLPAHSDHSRGKNSKVVLEGLPSSFISALKKYNAFVEKSFSGFFDLLVKSYQACPIGYPKELPVTGYAYERAESENQEGVEIEASDLGKDLMRNCSSVTVQGLPFSLCGHSTTGLGLFQQYIVPPIDERISMDPSLIPTIPYPRRDHTGRKMKLNAYALDFYRHGIRQALVKDNGLMEGDVFHMLKDFMLVLKAIVQVLEVVVKKPNDPVLRIFSELAEDYAKKFAEAFKLRYRY